MKKIVWVFILGDSQQQVKRFRPSENNKKTGIHGLYEMQFSDYIQLIPMLFQRTYCFGRKSSHSQFRKISYYTISVV